MSLTFFWSVRPILYPQAPAWNSLVLPFCIHEKEEFPLHPLLPLLPLLPYYTVGLICRGGPPSPCKRDKNNAR